MARLIFEKAQIWPANAPNFSGTPNVEITGVVSDSPAMSEEMLQVAIEDNQNVTEGYTTTMTFRTINTLDTNGTAILNAATDYVYFSASGQTLTKVLLRMVGINGGTTFHVDNVYVMGRRLYDNGREEIELSVQIGSVSNKLVVE